jgi:hypothetical protein
MDRGRGVDGAYKILLCKYPENYPESGRKDVKKFSSLITNFRKEAKKLSTKKLVLELIRCMSQLKSVPLSMLPRH